MYAMDYHDLGTPAAQGETVTLDINGATVTVPAGTSIMRAAALAVSWSPLSTMSTRRARLPGLVRCNISHLPWNCRLGSSRV